MQYIFEIVKSNLPPETLTLLMKYCDEFEEREGEDLLIFLVNPYNYAFVEYVVYNQIKFAFRIITNSKNELTTNQDKSFYNLSEEEISFLKATFSDGEILEMDRMFRSIGDDLSQNSSGLDIRKTLKDQK